MCAPRAGRTVVFSGACGDGRLEMARLSLAVESFGLRHELVQAHENKKQRKT